MKNFPSAPIAKYRLNTLFVLEQVAEDLQQKNEAEKAELIRQKDAEKNVEHLFNALDAFNLLADDIKAVFDDAGIKIDEEQLINVIADLRNISKGCETSEDFVKRIQDLASIGCFKKS